MAEEIRKYTSRKIYITPFGVDISLFRQLGKESDGVFTVGIVKTLEYGYGIDILIDAFALFREKYSGINMKLRVVGDGSLREKLEKQAKDLGIGDDIIFEGRVQNHKLPEILSSFDVFVALSRSESFGVAVVEAMACQWSRDRVRCTGIRGNCRGRNKRIDCTPGECCRGSRSHGTSFPG